MRTLFYQAMYVILQKIVEVLTDRRMLLSIRNYCQRMDYRASRGTD